MRTTRQRTPIAPVGLVALAASLSSMWPAAAQEGGTPGGRSSSPDAGWIDAALLATVRSIEIVGIVTIVVGAGAAIAIFLYRTVREGPEESEYQNFRATLGRSILLGLEFLVAADIINTVAIDPTLESVAVLAAIVAVRTFLSFALEVEIEGKWPWRKGSG